jgi:phosphoenolpyruvate---glycerone phosphotransferase subunit DhaL
VELDDFKKIAICSANILIENKEYFSQIDGKTGDGDHGITIGKIANTIIKISTDKSIPQKMRDYFSDICHAIMSINGGTSSMLWGMMVQGMVDVLADDEVISPKTLKAMFYGALEGIQSVSEAKPGDKTMIDALMPAVEAAQEAPDDELEILRLAAGAAVEGARKTMDMVAKYGRAKNLHEKSIGFLDAGAVSLSVMIKAIYDCYSKVKDECKCR